MLEPSHVTYNTHLFASSFVVRNSKPFTKVSCTTQSRIQTGGLACTAWITGYGDMIHDGMILDGTTRLVIGECGGGLVDMRTEFVKMKGYLRRVIG